MAESGLSVRRSCEAVGLSRAAWYKPPGDRLKRDIEVITVLTRVTAGGSGSVIAGYVLTAIDGIISGFIECIVSWV